MLEGGIGVFGKRFIFLNQMIVLGGVWEERYYGKYLGRECKIIFGR